MKFFSSKLDNQKIISSSKENFIINHLIPGCKQNNLSIIGPGDDSAALKNFSVCTLISVDTLLENNHFKLEWSSLYDIGRRAIAQNIADIEAMGGEVTAFIVALGIPKEASIISIDELYEGLYAEINKLGNINIIGGDIISSSFWMISITVLGNVNNFQPIKRSGAKIGDTIALIGNLGLSIAGYNLLKKNIKGFSYLKQQYLTPQPPYRQGIVAAKNKASAMTDISDGLLSNLECMATASNVSFNLYSNYLLKDWSKICKAASIAKENPWIWVLTGGEDHSLVATFPNQIPIGWRKVGYVVKSSNIISIDRTPWTRNKGWKAF